MTRRIGIIGARIHGRPDQARALVRSFAGQDVVVVSGGGAGIDTWVEDAAREVDLPVQVHHPERRTSEALLARDERIVADGLTELHAFPWWGARGTYYTMTRARQAGVPVVEHRKEPLVEVWTTRIGSSDPDELNVTREFADARAVKFRDGEVARLLGDHSPERRLYEMAIDMEERGRSLLELQREVVLPSPLTLGAPWAPSLGILRPALLARASANRMREVTGRDKEAAELEGRAWERYLYGNGRTRKDGFFAEMKRSQREKAIAWGWLLARRPRTRLDHPPAEPSRVVLACFCKDHAHCHRTVVAGLLGDLGAVVRGELPRTPRKDVAGDGPLFTNTTPRRPERS